MVQVHSWTISNGNRQCFFFLLQLTQGFRKASYSLEKFAQYMLWQYMNSDPFAQNPSNKVTIKVQLDPYKNGMTLNISTPSENTKFRNVPMPINMLHEPALMSMRKTLHKKIVDSLLGVDKTVCIIDKRVVKTFDNVTLERRPSSSWTLMAADSSGARNLAIYEKVVNQQSAVRVLLDDTVVEIDSSNLRHVQVNRKTKPLSPTEPIVVPDPASHKNLTEILMLGEDTVKVVMPKHYIKLLVTSEGLQIRASLLAYRNRMRGVCGDFNGEQRNDMMARSGCAYKDGQKFYESYREEAARSEPASSNDCVPLYS